MKSLRNYLSYLPKSFLAGLIGLMAIALPLRAVAVDPPVQIESTIGVANQTAGDTQYQSSVGAKVDDVVKIQVWYHNMEEEGSGKIADDLKVKIDIPKTAGKNQTVKATVGGTNTNQVVSTSNVNLSLANAYLEYIPGTAEWRHNAGTNDNVNYVTQTVSDNIVTSGSGSVLEDAQPCFNFEATVTVLARVKASEISITKQVRHLGETSADWKTENTADPGDTLEYLLTIKNEGNVELNNVLAGDNLPAYVSYVPGSAKLKNSNHPNGDPLGSDNLTTGGVNIGNYAPGSVAYVWFQAKVADQLDDCGVYTLHNVGVTDSDETGTFENYANTKVSVPCEEEAQFACESLSANPVIGLAPLKVSFKAEADLGQGVELEQYLFNFGDGQTATLGKESEGEVSHTYTQAGEYTASVRIKTNVGMTEETDACKVEINPTTTPPTSSGNLPRTGPGEVLGATFGTTALGATLRNWFRSKKALKDTLLNK